MPPQLNSRPHPPGLPHRNTNKNALVRPPYSRRRPSTNRRPPCSLPGKTRRQVRSPQPNGRPAPTPSIPSATASAGAGAPAPSSSSSSASSVVPEDVQFALEALHNLTTHCPDWAKRLDELSGQIDQRQADLAKLAEQQCPSRRSLRSRGSTESLKPRDDGEAHPGIADGLNSPDGTEDVVQTDGIPPQQLQEESSSGNDANSPTSSAVERQTPQVKAVASANARAALRRTQLGWKRTAAPDSLVTGDGVAPKYRSRSLVRVYYDSYVQSFFEEVVKFVSASRNLMRKAKMAAKVAQIKKMAERDMADDDGAGSDDGVGSGLGNVNFVPPRLSTTVQVVGAAPKTNEQANGQVGENPDKKETQQSNTEKPGNGEANGVLTATSPNRLSYKRSNGNGNGMSSPKLTGPIRPSMAAAWSSSFGSPADTQKAPDVFGELDKGLEVVQSTCEIAATKFLRCGDCADEVAKLKERLTDTKALADKEMHRMLEGDTDGSLKKLLAEGPWRNRAFGMWGVRKEPMRLRTSFAGASPAPGPAPAINGTNGSTGAGFSACAGTLQVDESVGPDDMSKEKPKLQYRSTRMMSSSVATGL